MRRNLLILVAVQHRGPTLSFWSFTDPMDRRGYVSVAECLYSPAAPIASTWLRESQHHVMAYVLVIIGPAVVFTRHRLELLS